MNRVAGESVMRFLMPFIAFLFWSCALFGQAQDWVLASNFESNSEVWGGQLDHTIVVRTNIQITDQQNQRTIPILVRYPAQLVATNQSLPVVIWSHGGGADPNGRNGSREWSESLVRAGFVVVHFSLLARDTAARAMLLQEFGLTQAQAQNCQFNSVYVDRPRDASAVISALPNLGELVPELQGRLDLTRIVMAGHSFGAYTARTVAGARVDLCPVEGAMPETWPYQDTQFRDDRPIAFLALSPQGPGRFSFFERGPDAHSWSTLNRPEFMATGAGDATAGELPADRLRSWQLIAPQNKYMMFIDSTSASHSTFNLNDPNTPEFSAWIADAAIAFLDAYVRNNSRAASWLHGNTPLQISQGLANLSRK
jgi:hypothetical protein